MRTLIARTPNTKDDINKKSNEKHAPNTKDNINEKDDIYTMPTGEVNPNHHKHPQ